MNSSILKTVSGLILPSALIGMALKPATPQNPQTPGERIFLKKCANCHGPKGEGTKVHAKPLTGDRSPSQLAVIISKTMPPGPVRTCTGEDARQVASYIHDAFYSPLAQARNKPARIELSRLTVRQYRNAVADIIGSFRSGDSWDERHGLRGEYFKAGRYRGNEKVMDRIDPTIQFEFGTSGPLPTQTDPYQFAMRWEGAVIAPDTGDYEFVIRTEHSVRFWVNNPRDPLIDAYVKSGDGTEYRASITLVGGRTYPVKLEFSKGVQGVDNLEKVKKKPPTRASLSLSWKRPKMAEEIIPDRALTPVVGAESFVPATPFPPDDRSIGYERGTSISKAWEEAATESALETAGYVSSHARELAGVPDDDPDRVTKMRAFCREFVERAFRRPLTEEVAKSAVDKPFGDGKDMETSIKRVVLATLMSPRFLYREVGGTAPDSFDVASRLSFGLWDTIPDRDLLKAAARGELATRDQLEQQAERMIASPRAWFKLREFFLQWLKVDLVPDISKDPKRYPGFDESVASDLRTSLELFLEYVMRNENSDYRQLLLSDKVVLNGRLSTIYGAKLSKEAPFQVVSLEPGERAGVLTQPYIMACFAYRESSSPIHRGVLIARNFMGRMLKPPVQAFTPLPAALHPNLTTRQRVSLQTKPAACVSCHGLINPLGFTLEKFDAVGRLQIEENGKPIDASGGYESATGKAVTFKGARDLGQFIAKSDEAHVAFVERLFHHLVKQPVRAYGPQTMGNLVKAFETNGYSIRKLMVEVMALSAGQH